MLAEGYKGVLFLKGLLETGTRQFRAVSYRQFGNRASSFDQFLELNRKKNITLEESRDPRIDDEQFGFVVGWQFLLRGRPDCCIVFHDSLLPKLRVFAPTVAALLCGAEVIGVTALRPGIWVTRRPGQVRLSR